jgi:putative aldouronate transport system permease protein
MNKETVNQISRKANAMIHFLFVLASLSCLFPFLLILSVSFSNEKAVVTEGYKLIPSQWSVAAYKFLFDGSTQIFKSYGVSILVTVLGTLASLAFIALYAYPLYRRDFPYRKFFAMFLFITMLFNGGLVPFYMLYSNYLHLKDTLVALILPYLLNPFYVIVMRTFFTSTIPDSVIESAKIDGAKDLFILIRIVFPLSLPAFATIGLFSTLTYWNDWFMSLLFIGKSNNVSLQYYMYRVMLNIQFLLSNTQLSASTASTMNIPGETVRMAMAVVGVGPIVFAYPFLQKYFVKGLTIGAVKG